MEDNYVLEALHALKEKMIENWSVSYLYWNYFKFC